MNPSRAHTRPPVRLAGLLLIWLFVPAILYAESASMYRVEMVLFRHADARAIHEEVWQSGRIARMNEAVDLHDANPATGFRNLSGTPFGLRGIVERLEQAPLYQVIASYAWEQPGLPMERALPVRIQAGPMLGRRAPERTSPAEGWRITPAMSPPVVPEPDPSPLYEVEGTVTLSLSRFLHLQTDLLYRRTVREDVSGAQVRTMEGGRFVESHVSERRRMRSREVHYLDHPLMGVIVEITPVE